MIPKIGAVHISTAKRIADMIDLSADNEKVMEQCLKLSPKIWVGWADDVPACIYGVIPPSLMSDQAYLWLYTTEKVKEHQFVFVRHSQIVVQSILEEYETLVGFTDPKAKKTVRWLKWLGAEFDKPRSEHVMPFVIRRK